MSAEVIDIAQARSKRDARRLNAVLVALLVGALALGYVFRQKRVKL